MQKIMLLIGTLALTCTACQSPKVKKQIAEKNAQIDQLEEQLSYLQDSNSSLLDRLADLSVINKNDAESIKNSITSINRQFDYIKELTSEIEQKDSINAVLVSNLKSSLIDFDDDDIQIEVKGNAVYVSISDRMLFGTGSSNVSKGAFNILEKVSHIINDNEELNVLVEGHTDDIPIANKNFKDNWDLSVSRATSVVRALQKNFDVDPARLTAAGKAEYRPKFENQTQTGRSQNRRTEIIITPKLDEFFKLLENPALAS